MARSRPRWLPDLRWLTASLLVTSAILIGVSFWALPHVYRWHTLNQLTASDATERERALNYVIRNAAQDPDVRRGAIARLADATNRQNFVQITNALDKAGVWSRKHIPDDAWLRWIGVLSADENAGARQVAASELSRLVTLADDPRLRQRLAPLLDDPTATVRFDALRATALLAARADTRTPYTELIAKRRDDSADKVARYAWLLLGMLDWTPEAAPDWRAASPDVAASMLWHMTQTDPQRAQQVIDAAENPDVEPAKRAMAIYALAALDDWSHARAFTALPANPARTQPAAQAVQRLRRVLVAGHLRRRFADEFKNDPPADITAFSLPQALRHDGAFASVPALAWATAPQFDPLRIESSDELNQLHPMALLAYLEGCAPGAARLGDTGPLSSMLRIAAARKMPAPAPDMLEDAFMSRHATVRDLACLVAVERFEGEALKSLAHSLLTNLNNEARMSGAILSGLTGMHTDFVQQRATEEENWPLRQIMQLGLWMQGERPEMRRRVTGLLARRDVPMSTVLLALLHKGHPEGMDYLLAPRSAPPPDLHGLLVRYRWWHVLRTHLPADAPPLWLWADQRLQRFQIDVLRAWYLLHRHELTAAAERD